MSEPAIAGDALARVCGAAGFDRAKSDGCTLAPDGWWREACVTHDSRYFEGGSAADRLRADQELRDNMIKQGAPKAVANLYYYAVRVGGAPGTGLPWQWGFGKK
jgi:hypothetical protein